MEQRRSAEIVDLATERSIRRKVWTADGEPLYSIDVNGCELAVTEAEVFALAQRAAESQALFALQVRDMETLRGRGAAICTGIDRPKALLGRYLRDLRRLTTIEPSTNS